MKIGVRSQIAQELAETGTLKSFRVIDAHGHMGGFAGSYLPNDTPARMIRTLDRCGVERLIFSHHEALQDGPVGNLKALAAIAEYPDRLLGYWAVNPNYPDQLRRDVAAWPARRGLAGYKILAGYYRAAITLPACQPLWAHAHEARLPVLVHTWGGDAYAGPAQIAAVARRYSGATILMGHSMHGDWDGAIDLATRFRNVYCELCAAYATQGVIRKLVDAGLEDQILFGTDLPWFDPMYGIGCVVFAHISEAARRKILRDNAERIFARFRG